MAMVPVRFRWMLGTLVLLPTESPKMRKIFRCANTSVLDALAAKFRKQDRLPECPETKLKHGSGFQAEIATEAAPVLDVA